MALGTFLRRMAMPLLLSTSLVNCSTDGLLPPGDIDGSMRVSSVQPVAPVGELAGTTIQTYPAPAGAVAGGHDNPPVRRLAPNDGRAPIAATSAALPMVSSSGQGAFAIPADGINMDEGLGVAPVVGLAEEQSQDIAESATSQPVIGGIGTDNPQQRARPAALPASELAPELAKAPVWGDQTPVTMPSRPKAPMAEQGQQVAFLGRPENPMAAPQSTPPGVMPASERSCRDELRRLGVEFRDIARISNGPTCGIDYPIELSGLSGNIQVKPATRLNCQVTLAFAKWVKYELAPSSRARYWSGVQTIVPLGGYSCRRMNSSGRNPWSEHAKGNAIDVGKFVLKNGKQIDVRKPGFFAFREKGLLKAVRSDSCKYFHTVLGPGSDRHHNDHFHFDLRTRKSGYRHCD